MSKYIIEIEGEPFVKLSALFGKEGLYRAKGFKSLVFDQLGLDKLTPLDKALDEAYQKGYNEAKLIYQNPNAESDYQRGLDDAWEAAREIVWNTSFDDWKSVGVDIGEWDGDESEALNRYSVSEVIEILKKMGKPNPDEIKVGDEVKSLETGCTYIIHETDEKYVRGYNFKIRYTCYGEKNKFKKTGRHFPQVAELLKVMKEGAE